jgi:DNA-binding IclR family transcriptional regulator
MTLPGQVAAEKMIFRKTPGSPGTLPADQSGAFFPMRATGKPKTQSVPALERALQMLECLAKSQHGVTHSQVTRRLQLPRSTCHALLLTFERCGYMERDKDTGRYRLGFKLYALANKSLGGIRLRDQAAPILGRLMRDTGLAVHLAVFVESEAVLIDRIEPPGFSKLAGCVGKRIGLHSTALGKALIAHLPEDEVNELVLKQGLLRYNENTIASAKKLRLACESVRQLGYAIDDGEEEIGIRSIGAPVLDAEGRVIASIGVSGPAPQIENISALGRQVRKAAMTLTCELGRANDEDHGFADRADVPASVGWATVGA